MDITLRQLSYFEALAETRSFSVAAARVNISQPALSIQIKELETRLEAQLIERLPRDIRLTRAGQIVLERAQKLLADSRALKQAVRLQSGLAGRLTLGVIPTIAPYLLPQALTRIRAADLSLEIRVHEAQTEILLGELAQGRIDAAVLSLPIAQAGLEVRALFEDRFVLAGSAARIAGLREQGEALRPTHIPQDQLLLLDEGHCLGDQALEVCGLDRRAARVDLGASSLATLAGLVAEGFGLTFLPQIALRTESQAAPSLALMRFRAPEPRRRIALVRRKSSEDAGWFGELGDLLAEAGAALLEQGAQACDPL
ncbi:MAG: LysR family hydrogen peroxide-inducible transcriptional activator [Halocynthiibacter sp.]|jgi:LysR family hydrogen peroxide-inducible transcriptional activator